MPLDFVSHCLQQLGDEPFRGRAFTANPRHDRGSLLFRENVGHASGQGVGERFGAGVNGVQVDQKCFGDALPKQRGHGVADLDGRLDL